MWITYEKAQKSGLKIHNRRKFCEAQSGGIPACNIKAAGIPHEKRNNLNELTAGNT